MYQYIVRIGNAACPRYYSTSGYEFKTVEIAKAAARNHLNNKGFTWSEQMIHTKREGVRDVQETKRHNHIKEKKRKLLAKQSKRTAPRLKRSACRSKGIQYKKS